MNMFLYVINPTAEYLNNHSSNDLLYISFVLVLQKRIKYEPVPIEKFPPSLLITLHREVLKLLSLSSILDPGLFMSIKGILQIIVAAVESLLPAMKDLDAGEIGESELACSIMTKCTNTIPENGTDVGRRPDYEVTTYEQYQPPFRRYFGKLKGGESSDISAIMYFYCLGVFAKLEIFTRNLTSVLCSQALGTAITFYALTHPHPRIYTFIELAPVTIPKTKNAIMFMISAFDDLFKIAVYHRTISNTPITNA
ncbi:hypothetical protein J3Q64DRAFT_1808287 [Phycomyces blakesleeanus]|uniref:Uncharacterized protein n=1 Tax=Phycomyces blakesleeanus TaxID=4837 RepID=A0ABR3B6H5_PHYBL